MKKKVVWFLACLIFSVSAITAQNLKVTGIVISEEDGDPIVGASVLVDGTNIGTITDMDGQFSLPRIPSSAKTLTVSFVGMIPQKVAVKEGVMKIALKSDAQSLDEVVVTAMGMKRSEKGLGYSASTVKSDKLDAARSGSVMSGLTGKVAGVNITNGGSTGSSQKVLIRGISSLNSNSPLYIVDGVPINSDRLGGNNYADFGSGVNDINSEDVESVTVLKGASATALYGSRAANGVIMITTKKASTEKFSIVYDGAYTFSDVLRTMQTQDLFGQGWGSWDRAENGSWGPRLDGTMHEWGSSTLDPQMVKPYSYVKNNIRDFYKTGFETNNVVSVRAGGEKLGVVATYGNLYSNGLLPNNGDKYDRNTFSLRGYAKADRLTFDMTMNYVHKNIRRADSMNMELLQHAVDISFADQKDYNDVRFDTDNYYTWYAQNPYWMVDNFYYTYSDDRVYGKVELALDLYKGLKAVGRLGGDFTNASRKNMNAKLTYSDDSYSTMGGKNPENGYYGEYAYRQAQIDATAWLQADYNVFDNALSINAAAGWNLNQRSFDRTGGYVDGLDIPGWYSLLNSTTGATADPDSWKRRLIGAFAQAEFGFKNYLYLNLSARNDWSSTLPKNNRSFFYGGANVSWVVSELFPALKDNYVDFFKLRAAYGQTGSDAGVYKTETYFKPGRFYYTYLPINGVTGLTENTTKPSTDLKPEITTEMEFGLSAHLFKGLLQFDVAYYDRTTKDQIIEAALAPETGYTKETRNVGKIRNRGVELMATAYPIRNTNGWTWSVGFTFAKNKSKVVELWDGLKDYTYTSWRGIEYVLEKGQEVGQFRIPAVQTVDDENSPYYGYRVVNNNGWLNQDDNKKEVVGSSQPKFTMGFNTSVTWKNFTLTAVGDWRKGGMMVSNTSYITHFNGNSTQTVFNERNSYVVPNAVKIVDGQYVENNIVIRADYMTYAQGNYSYDAEILRRFILKRDYFKLREVALNYQFPSAWFKNTSISQLNLTLIGRNLFLKTPKSNNYVDPEVSNLGNDLLSEFGETTGTQSTRNIGFAVKVVF